MKDPKITKIQKLIIEDFKKYNEKIEWEDQIDLDVSENDPSILVFSSKDPYIIPTELKIKYNEKSKNYVCEVLNYEEDDPAQIKFKIRTKDNWAVFDSKNMIKELIQFHLIGNETENKKLYELVFC